MSDAVSDAHPHRAADLVVTEVMKTYGLPAGDVEVLRGVSFRAAPGQSLAVMGPSGSGKSTLLNIIGSLDRPTQGSVCLGELEVTRLAGRALAQYRATRVGFVFQDHHLLPQCTARENVWLPTLAAGGGRNAAGRVDELLGRVGLAARADHFPATLSGGERQRVAIARALVNRPCLLLADEPTGNLDQRTAAGVVDLLLELVRQEQLILIVATHDGRLASRLDRCLELVDGRVHERPSSGGRS